MLKKATTRSIAAKKGWETRRRNIEKMKRAMEKKKSTVSTKEGAPKEAKQEISPSSLKEPVIKKWFGEGSLNQIYSRGLEYAFTNEKGVQCHPFAYCKDYLQDAIWATLNESTAQIHGFRYAHGTNPPLDLERTRMALRFKNQESFDKLVVNSLKFMHKLEEAQGFEPSELHYGGKYMDKTHPIYVFFSDKRWMFSPVLISLYTLALRVGLSYEGGDWKKHFSEAKKYYGSNDRSYTSRAKKAVDEIVGKKLEEIFAPKLEENYPKDMNMMGLHHRSGIVSYGTNAIDQKVKTNWAKKGA